MEVNICRHIRYSGIRCASPALRGKDLCYHHDTFHQRHEPLNPPIPPELLARDGITAQQIRHPDIAEDTGYKPKWPTMLNLPTIEDRDSLQLAISMVVTALGEYRIKPVHANSILFGLQLALANLRRVEPSTLAPVTDFESGPDGHALALCDATTPPPAAPSNPAPACTS
jgi:hypothetical protein